MNDMPFVSDHYTPVAQENTAHALTVHGTLPPELTGHYFRNGHNPKPGVVPTHWFKGAGMVHGLRLRGGEAEWYRNRWVRTPAFDGAPLQRPDGTIDLTASVAGTHVIEHAGRILALQEANLPFELTTDLTTVGPYDFNGKLTTAMTAHPKEDPTTGELHFFAYSPFPPHLVYYVADAAGEIIRNEVVDGAGPSLMHDFAITENHVVWLDMSVVFDHTEQSGIPYRWHDDYAPRIGVMPRTGTATVTWYDTEPGALLHVANAYEDTNGHIHVEGPRFDRPSWEASWKWWTGTPGHPENPLIGAVHHRWTLDPTTHRAKEELLDNLPTDFPTINDAVLGRRNRYSYAIAFPGGGLHHHAIVKYDNNTGQRQLSELGADRIPGEAVFVAAENGTAEDDGYLLTIITNRKHNTSEFSVLNANNISAPPVATVELPHRVPGGIHGSWIADA